MHHLYWLVVVFIMAGLRLATCGRVATRHIVTFLVAGLRLATLHGLHVATSLIINYSLWRHICVRKGRGRGPGRKRGQGARQRSTADYREKRQRQHEGLWQEGWAGGWDDKDESSQWRNDDDSWDADDSPACTAVHVRHCLMLKDRNYLCLSSRSHNTCVCIYRCIK